MNLFRQIKNTNLRIMCILYCFVVLLMVSGYKGIANYLSFVLLIVVLVVYFGVNRGKINLNNKIGLYIFVFMLFYLLTSLVVLDVDFFLVEYAYYAIAFSPALITYVIAKEKDVIAAKSVLIISLLLWTLMCIYSIYLYVSNPQFARLAAADQSLVSGIIFGGYPLAIGSAILSVYLLGLLLEKWHILTLANKCIIIAFCVLLAVTVYLTESTITTICMIVGFVATVSLNKREKNERNRFLKIFIFISVLFIVGIVINSNLTYIYSWLDDHSDNLLFYRIKEVINALFFDTETSHYIKRSDTLSASFNTFINNPIIGVGYKYGNVTSIGKTQFGIGNHSEIFDSLAQFGLIGAFPFLMSYYLAIKSIADKYIGVVVTVFFLMLLNPFFYFDSNHVVFMILPLFELILNTNKTEKTI